MCFIQISVAGDLQVERTEDLSVQKCGGGCLNSWYLLLLFVSFSPSLYPHHPPPLPLSLFVLLSLLVLNESMRRSLAQGCSSANACLRRDWPRRGREKCGWGKQRPTVPLNKHLHGCCGPVWINTLSGTS